MTAWQPIESAPRDEDVLVFIPNSPMPVSIANWQSDDGEWWQSEVSGGAMLDVTPTHWQPLPEPPPPSVETVTRLLVPQAAVAPREMPALGWDEALVTG